MIIQKFKCKMDLDRIRINYHAKITLSYLIPLMSSFTRVSAILVVCRLLTV